MANKTRKAQPTQAKQTVTQATAEAKGGFTLDTTAEAVTTPITTADGTVKAEHSEALATIQATAQAERSKAQTAKQEQPTAEQTAQEQAKAQELKDKAQEQAESIEAQKPTEEQKAAEAFLKIQQRFGYKESLNRFDFATVTYNKDGREVKLSTRCYTVPKSVKADRKHLFAAAVQKQILLEQKLTFEQNLVNKQKALDKTADVDKAERLQAEIEDIKKQHGLADTMLDVLNVRKVIYDKFAYLVACDILKKPISIECEGFRSGLKESCEILTEKVTELQTAKETKLSEAQAEALDNTRKALKACLENFAQETELCERFKVSVGAKDLTDLFKSSHDDKGNYNYTADNKKKLLERQIANIYLKKLKAEETTNK